MSETAEKSDPDLWEAVKSEITAGAKGGKAGQWSARKAQMAVQAYKRRGGGYVGAKPDPDNHLIQWEKEDWGTKSGAESLESGERYLPRKAREALSDEEYARTTAKKRAALKRGEQFAAQPADVARKAARFRDGHGAHGEKTRADLLDEAKRRGIVGRSKMTKAELAQALH
jgi:hypothetical protein